MGEMGWCGDGVEEVGRAGKIDDSDQRAYYIRAHLYSPPQQPFKSTNSQDLAQEVPSCGRCDLDFLSKHRHGFSSTDLMVICQCATKLAICQNIEAGIQKAREKWVQGEVSDVKIEGGDGEDSVPIFMRYAIRLCESLGVICYLTLNIPYGPHGDVLRPPSPPS